MSLILAFCDISSGEVWAGEQCKIVFKITF